MQSQKRIIICCDGTWQSSASLHGKDSPPSNVERMRQVIAKTGTDMKKQIWQQNIHYIPGVGSEDLSQAEKTRQGRFIAIALVQLPGYFV
ncbi:hypothetical protein BKA66DRAFT_455876 [Pyrenochaeta sp. MPI-SDFR-AT-0127]|nr:hypothetical protein BKA66DRAFT_455876 [Pyrenochaeta sp. MPI-SDFR-AT-0127]